MRGESAGAGQAVERAVIVPAMTPTPAPAPGERRGTGKDRLWRRTGKATACYTNLVSDSCATRPSALDSSFSPLLRSVSGHSARACHQISSRLATLEYP